MLVFFGEVSFLDIKFKNFSCFLFVVCGKFIIFLIEFIFCNKYIFWGYDYFFGIKSLSNK